jgi:hypothetical protein
LQAYATQVVFQKAGGDVEVVDYITEQRTNKRLFFSVPASFRGGIVKKTIYILLKSFSVFIKKKTFGGFVKKNCNLTSRKYITAEDLKNDPPKADIYVTGSDQVWNRRLTKGTDPIYWGCFRRGKDTAMISYAASMEDGADDATSMEIRSWLPAFDALSVREESLCKAMKECLPDKPLATVVDPVLLIEESQWDGLSADNLPDEPYLLYYQVRKSNEALEIAKRKAEEKGLKLLVLSAKLELGSSFEIASSSPSEFVSLFRNASYVVTTSFHGTAFSVIFHKEFICVDVADGKNTRQEDLLSSLGLESRMVKGCNVPVMPVIDWNETDRKREAMVKVSRDYLTSCGL